MLLANDDYYQNLKRIIKTVEDLYNELGEDMHTIVDMRHWIQMTVMNART